MATPSVPAGFKLVPDDDGQTNTPVARGKAAALSSYLVKRGNPTGKRLDRIMLKFEKLWREADPRTKDKYANRYKSDLAPVEAAAYKAQMTPPPISPPKKTLTHNGTPIKKQLAQAAAVPVPGNSFDDLTKMPVATGGVNSIGDGKFEAGKVTAMEQRRQAGDAEAQAAMNKASMPKPIPAIPPSTSPAPISDRERARTASTSLNQSQKPEMGPPKPSIPPQSASSGTPAINTGNMKQADEARTAAPAKDTSTPFGRAVDSTAEATMGALYEGYKAIVRPLKSDVDAAKEDKDYADMKASEKARSDAATKSREAEVAKIKGETPPPMAATATPSPASTPPPVVSPAESYQGPMSRNPVAGQPSTATSPPVAAPAPTLGRPEPTRSALVPAPDFVNAPGKELTGMSAGRPTYSPVATPRPSPPVAPPRATIAPATARYADAQSQYQKDLDPAKAKEMDKVYAGANSLDQAKITAQSLKRAGALNRTQTQPPVRRPMRV